MREPELSILLVTDSAALLRRVLDGYRDQADVARLEIVIAALSNADPDACAREATQFASTRVVEVAERDIAIAEWHAVRAASAPFVVFAQVHAIPRPGFVAAIAAACRSGSWTVVGPSVEDANRDSLVSRAAMRIQYGPWMGMANRGPSVHVPGHNSAYERAALLALGDDLVGLLDVGSALQTALRERGGTLLYEPAARIAIVAVSEFGWFLVDQFDQSRRYAARRSRRWSSALRVAFALGSPLIPLVRFLRIAAQLRRDGGFGPALPALPALLVGLVSSAAGECVGYLAGDASSARATHMALHRTRHVQDEW